MAQIQFTEEKVGTLRVLKMDDRTLLVADWLYRMLLKYREDAKKLGTLLHLGVNSGEIIEEI